jgi:3-deoxy-D-manno-octulosonic-acid transferase
MYLLYSAALALAMAAALPFWLWQMLRHGKYRAGWGERWGKPPGRIFTADPRPVIWLHAVSVGEVLAVSGLVAELNRLLPGHRVVVSTTTDTGQKLARERFGETNVFYFPLDFAFALRPYLRRLAPHLVVLAETEFWPNFLRLAPSAGARVAVVNGRISDRSFPGYRRFRWLLATVLRNVDVFLSQTGEDNNRLLAIGAPPGRVQVSGNLKFDAPAPVPPPLLAQLTTAFRQGEAGPILVCGSTVEGEEALLIPVFREILSLHPRAVMLLAPRRPERFGAVAQLAEASGIPSWRRSQWDGSPLAGGIVILDSIGELAALYALADIAFVGGSLVPAGGHNILEPARYGVAVVTGPHTENFRDIVELFRAHGAVRITDAARLKNDFLGLASAPALRSELGSRAAELVRSQMGATERTVQALLKLLDAC